MVNHPGCLLSHQDTEGEWTGQCMYNVINTAALINSAYEVISTEITQNVHVISNLV